MICEASEPQDKSKVPVIIMIVKRARDLKFGFISEIENIKRITRT